ncbi:MAG: hypothetical protein ACYS4W_14490, partial [Planctomycetota bacterium]
MKTGPDKGTGEYKRWIVSAYIGVMILFAVVASLVFFTNIFDKSSLGSILRLIWGVIVFVLIWMLAKLFKILDAVQENNAKLERMIEALEKNRPILGRIDEGVRLSDTARFVLYREAERESLRQAVLEVLKADGADAAVKLIEQIGARAGYAQFAEELKTELASHDDAASRERLNQGIEAIEELLEKRDWPRASVQIEKLIGTYPKSEQARELRQKLADKMEARKKLLMTSWDDAVQRGATDRSLGILKELDQYLTPNEGLALQESAKDVFKTKLHNLGVQFSLAVS